MVKRYFSKGDIIFSEGDLGNSFFQIIDGTAGVYLNYGSVEQRKLTELSDGQYFGEMAVIESWPRSTTIVAESNLNAYEIEEDGLDKLFEEQPEKILEIMKHLGRRIRSLTAEYAEVNVFLNDIKAFRDESIKQNEGIVTKIKKYLGIYNAAQKNLKKPSVEALREAKISKKDASAVPIEKYEKDTIIFKKGEIGRCMYAVQSGAVNIYDNYASDDEKLLTTLLPGTFFGEMGMIEEEARSATAVAAEDDTYVEIIRPEDLDTLFKADPTEVNMILRHLSHRLRQLTDDYMDVCKEVCETWASL